MSFMDFGGLSDSVKKMTSSFKKSVNPMDVLVGALAAQTIGKVLGAQIKTKLAPSLPASMAQYAVQYSDELGGIATGAILFVAQKGSSRAAGHLVGAVGGALLPPASSFITAKLVEYKVPGFGELQAINYGSYGELVAMGELRAMGDFSDFSGEFNGIEEEAVI